MPRGRLGLGGDILGLADAEGNPTQIVQKIIDARPDYLKVGTWSCGYDSYKWAKPNLTPQVVKALHDAGIKVYAHVCNTGTQGISKTPFEDQARPMLDRIFAQVPEIDGISDGEVHNWESAKSGHALMIQFFKDYYNYIKSKGNYEVRYNTGTWYTFEGIMECCDVLSVEWSQGRPEQFFEKAPNQYGVLNGEWTRKYPSTRFECSPLAYSWTGTLQDAIDRIKELWDLGFGDVSITHSTWSGWGGTHPFPLRYDWMYDLIEHFKTTPPPPPPPESSMLWVLGLLAVAGLVYWSWR